MKAYVTTRAQRLAVYTLFRRTYCNDNEQPHCPESEDKIRFVDLEWWAEYRMFRRGFRPGFCGELGGDWQGMYVGIEPDGYTHT